MVISREATVAYSIYSSLKELHFGAKQDLFLTIDDFVNYMYISIFLYP